ncbi:MAG: hypothetical protein FWG69_00745 [Oscillospiraceae bacterium]|nr:hypothetical protein [Oscillospiraceae bacterium]
MKKKKEKNRTMEKARKIIRATSSKNDPQGSYTGKPAFNDKKPVQDADDI